MSVLVIVSLLQMFLSVWNGPTTNLGELARREAVRRQAVTASARALTDADIGPPPERTPKPTPAAGVDVAEPVKPGEKPADPPKPPKDEAWWRARMVAARGALERDKLLLTALENRVATLTRDVANRDNPAQRALLISERIRALEELELMRKQLVADAEAITAIEDDAKRQGVPPGWIRLN